jgi:hypothetical protein
VDDEYFEYIERDDFPREVRIVGSVARGPLVRRNWELAFARIQRVRGDIEWRLLDAPPSPRGLAAYDLWVDPAEAEDDFDGFVSEAIAAGVPVVAARTEINRARTNSGRAGLLARRGDHNELAHAVLSGLFKDELTEPRRLAARDFRETFRVEARRRAVASVYRELAG